MRIIIISSMRKVAIWQERLGLATYVIGTERISPLAVCDEQCRVGNHLVGVVADHAARTATIYHTRRLTTEDVIHELLHVRHPEWSEAEVVAETDRQLANATRQHPLGVSAIPEYRTAPTD